jgi:hypothetical protein
MKELIEEKIENAEILLEAAGRANNLRKYVREQTKLEILRELLVEFNNMKS